MLENPRRRLVNQSEGKDHLQVRVVFHLLSRLTNQPTQSIFVVLEVSFACLMTKLVDDRG